MVDISDLERVLMPLVPWQIDRLERLRKEQNPSKYKEMEENNRLPVTISDSLPDYAKKIPSNEDYRPMIIDNRIYS